jgi:hypothetical protein
MLTDVSEVCTASIIIIIVIMMEAVRTSETSVNVKLTTWHYIPEDFKFHTRHRENLKSHILVYIMMAQDVGLVYLLQEDKL